VSHWATAEVTNVWNWLGELDRYTSKPSEHGPDISLVRHRYDEWRRYRLNGSKTMMSDTDVWFTKRFSSIARTYATEVYPYVKRVDFRAKTAAALRALDREIAYGEAQLKCREVLNRLGGA
jgi:hypothetical protein